MSYMPKAREGGLLLQSGLLQEKLGRSVPRANEQDDHLGSRVLRLRTLADSPQSTHKAQHKAQNSMLSKVIPPKVVSLPDADGHFNPFPSYPFTGTLRPVYPLSPRRTVPDRIRHPDYAHNGIPKSEQVSLTKGVW